MMSPTRPVTHREMRSVRATALSTSHPHTALRPLGPRALTSVPPCPSRRRARARNTLPPARRAGKIFGVVPAGRSVPQARDLRQRLVALDDALLDRVAVGTIVHEVPG